MQTILGDAKPNHMHINSSKIKIYVCSQEQRQRINVSRPLILMNICLENQLLIHVQITGKSNNIDWFKHL